MTEPAVSDTYMGLLTVKVGNFASARITPCKRRVQLVQSVQGTTTIAIIPLESQSAQAAELASQSSQRESVGSRYTKSQKACVYPAVAVMVIPVYFQSALHAGSSPIDAFSARS